VPQTGNVTAQLGHGHSPRAKRWALNGATARNWKPKWRSLKLHRQQAQQTLLKKTNPSKKKVNTAITTNQPMRIVDHGGHKRTTSISVRNRSCENNDACSDANSPQVAASPRN